MTAARQFQRALQLGYFALAPDELGKPAPRCQFEMAACRFCPDHLVDVDWLADAFDFSRPEVAQFEVTLDQMPRILAITMPPAGATVCIRAARLAACPTGVYSVCPPVWIMRRTTSPVLIPIRTSTPDRPCFFRSWQLRRSASRIAIAACSARCGWSS